jgi:hypothetical protein
LWGKVELPAWGFLCRGEWKSGRKLAHVNADANDAWAIGAGTAWFGFAKHKGPPLPNWSWMFDYIDPDITNEKRIVGAFSSSETDKNRSRSKLVVWPTEVVDGQDYRMHIEKLPRQGAYDNIHMHPEMLEHEPPHEHQPLLTAPFCAEKCFHLHWRWGITSINSLSVPYEFLGWVGSGATAVAHGGRGTPLIPPNQHLDVTIKPTPEGNQPTQITVLYEVRADEPKANEQQVFLEQGLGLAYRYAVDERYAPKIFDLTNLMVAVGALSGPGKGAEELRLRAAKLLSPALFDAYLREDFHKIYSRIRYYDKVRDKVQTDDVQQVPFGSRTVTTDPPADPLNLETL